MALKPKKPEWKATVSFASFESESQRDRAYRDWVRLFIRAKENELKGRATQQKRKGAGPFN